MKKRYTEEQIIKAIKEHKAGVKVDDIYLGLNISNGTFYNWRSKYAGLEVNQAKRLRQLEAENNKFKKLIAEKLLENEAMKDCYRSVECIGRSKACKCEITVLFLGERSIRS